MQLRFEDWRFFNYFVPDLSLRSNTFNNRKDILLKNTKLSLEDLSERPKKLWHCWWYQISCWELILQETNFCWELPFWFNVSRNIYFRDAWVSFWSWFGFGSGGSFFNTKAVKRKQGYKHLENLKIEFE